MARKRNQENHKTLAELLQNRETMQNNEFYRLSKLFEDIEINTVDEFKTYIDNVLHNTFISKSDELPIWFRKTDGDKSRTFIDEHYLLPKKSVAYLVKEYNDGKIDEDQLQIAMRTAYIIKQAFKQNKEIIDAGKNHIDFARVVQYQNFMSCMSKRTILILIAWDLFNEDISYISESDAKKFFKKYKYDLEHTFNTHFTDPCDLSSAIPLPHELHNGTKEFDGKHKIFGQVPMYKLIARQTNGKKLEANHANYLYHFKPIYDMSVGKNKIIATFKKYDKIFGKYDKNDKVFSQMFINNFNTHFHLNIDENYIVNYVI